jgi:hypothetical protein
MTEAAKSADRHLTPESFELCVRSLVPVEHLIRGNPPVALFIDPDREEIGLRVPASGNDGPIDTGRENVRVLATHRPDGRFLEIVVDDPSLFTGAYPLLCLVADRVQLDGLDLPSALASSVRLLDQLLKRDVSLTVEREIGLFGELLVVRNLCGQLGIADAIAAWRSSETEEHDFSIYGIDVEVKTTTAERRAHWIASLTQLVPTGERPLWLISHQVTRAGAGNGLKLRDLIADTRRIVGNDQLRDSFERHLAAAGWADAHERTVRDGWFLRTPSLAFPVVASFPQLTPSILSDAGLALVRIADVRYRIDLTGLPSPSEIPEIIASMLPSGGAL